MTRNFKIYLSFFIASLKKMFEYRADCIIGSISQVAFQIIELIFIWIIFQNTDSIAGWSFEHLLLFYGVMMLSVSVLDLFFDSTYEVGRTLIRKGKFDTILLRPVHPLISILRKYKWLYCIGIYNNCYYFNCLYSYKASNTNNYFPNFENSIFWNFRWNYYGWSSDYF